MLTPPYPECVYVRVCILFMNNLIFCIHMLFIIYLWLLLTGAVQHPLRLNFLLIKYSCFLRVEKSRVTWHLKVSVKHKNWTFHKNTLLSSFIFLSFTNIFPSIPFEFFLFFRYTKPPKCPNFKPKPNCRAFHVPN